MLRKGIVIALLLVALGWLQPFARAAELAPAATIQFSGYTWEVRSGGGGPGPNNWSAQNVWVDANGYLHLKLSKVNGQWYAAELNSVERFGFGTYQWQIIGRVDQLDRNVVLGLFNYPPTADVGPDGTNEIDIEFARWGNAAWPNLNYTVYPAVPGPNPASDTYNFALTGDYTTHRFNWNSTSVFYQSLHGHTDSNTNEFRQWNFAPQQPQRDIPQKALPVHMNLWLFEGRAPANGQEVEVVIRKFTYTPASTPETLAAPSNLAATTASAAQIDLAWSDNSATESGFKLERCQGATCTAFTQVATTAANVRSYANTGLLANTTYCYRVRAYTGALNSAYSNTICRTTGPLPPTTLSASRLLATEVNLAWIETSNNESGFKLERCTGSTCTNFAQIALMPANGIGYHDTGLTAKTAYRYRVAAYNATGNSGYAPILTLTTAAVTAAQSEAMPAAEWVTAITPLFQSQAPLTMDYRASCINDVQPTNVTLQVGPYTFPMTATAELAPVYRASLSAAVSLAVDTDYLMHVQWQCADSAVPLTDYIGLLQSTPASPAPADLNNLFYLPVVLR